MRASGPRKGTTAVGLRRMATLAVAMSASPLMAADIDVRQTSDYLAIVIEAEDFDAKDERWILTEPNTPAQSDDPDANHSAGAIGQAYLELLPDHRVTHEDPFPTDPEIRAFWGNGAIAPRADYQVDFPEAGRYHIHVRALSTGTEDNGLHMGLNGQFPTSASKIQLCSAGQGWSWSSRQRDSGAAGSCGTDFTLWIDVEEPGINTLNVAPREDGFELDRLMLIKDLSGATRRCRGRNEDDIQCLNGGIESEDAAVNLEVQVNTDLDEIDQEERVAVTVNVRNDDKFDTATDVVLILDPVVDADWQTISAPEECVHDGAVLMCAIGDIEPSENSESHELAFEFEAVTAGLTEFSATATAGEVDVDPTRATGTARVDVIELARPTELSVSEELPSEIAVGDRGLLTFSVSNIGENNAEDLVVDVNLSAALELLSIPGDCQAQDSAISCERDDLTTDDTWQLVFGFRATEEGTAAPSLTVSAKNAEPAGAQAMMLVAAVQEEVVPEIIEPEPTPSEEENTEVETVESEEAPKRSSSGATGFVWLFIGAAMLAARRIRRRVALN